MATPQRLFLAECLELAGTHFSALRETRASSGIMTEWDMVTVPTEMSLLGPLTIHHIFIPGLCLGVRNTASSRGAVVAYTLQTVQPQGQPMDWTKSTAARSANTHCMMAWRRFV
jgi:hypothetical protein